LSDIDADQKNLLTLFNHKYSGIYHSWLNPAITNKNNLWIKVDAAV